MILLMRHRWTTTINDLKCDTRLSPQYEPQSVIIGCVAKYELTKIRCDEGMFCSEIEVFRQEMGHRSICYII